MKKTRSSENPSGAKIEPKTLNTAAAESALETPVLDGICDEKTTAAVQQGGLFRFDLLALIGVVLLLNIPFFSGRYMSGGDTKYIFGIFDYFYSNWLFSGELPHWMVYGVYGLDASPFHHQNMSAASYLSFFAGKLFGVKDSLVLFSMMICIEQLMFLLGLYLLCRQLFKERLTVFCICLTSVCTVVWHWQLFFNFRLYYLLPFAFYFLLLFRQREKGAFGWLAGIVVILGLLGSPTYCYPLWAFVITVFFISLFWGEFRSLRLMIQVSPLNIIAAIGFITLSIIFVGNFWHSLENFSFQAPGRDGSGSVSLSSFLTYGGNNMGENLRSLLYPSACMSINDGQWGHLGMTNYLGLVGIFGLPFAFRSFGSPGVRSFAILIFAISAFQLEGSWRQLFTIFRECIYTGISAS